MLSTHRKAVTGIDNPHWVYGLRQRASHHAARPVAPSLDLDWLTVVCALIVERFDRLGMSSATEAELGLHIDPSWYFFICCSKHCFGNGVFLYNVPDSGWSDADGGCCPFDTGGLWKRKVKTTPPDLTATGDARLRFFAAHNHKLNNWPSPFWNYVKVNYSDLSAYVRGELPDPKIGKGIEAITACYRAAIVNHDSDSRAWTWEGRLVRWWPKRRAKPENFVCSKDHRKFISRKLAKLLWLEHYELDYISKWLRSHVIDSSTSVGRTSVRCAPAEKAQETLIERFGG